MSWSKVTAVYTGFTKAFTGFTPPGRTGSDKWLSQMVRDPVVNGKHADDRRCKRSRKRRKRTWGGWGGLDTTREEGS